MYRLTFIIYHLSFIIHHSSFIIHHSSFIIHLSSSFIIHHYIYWLSQLNLSPSVLDVAGRGLSPGRARPLLPARRGRGDGAVRHDGLEARPDRPLQDEALARRRPGAQVLVRLMILIESLAISIGRGCCCCGPAVEKKGALYRLPWVLKFFKLEIIYIGHIRSFCDSVRRLAVRRQSELIYAMVCMYVYPCTPQFMYAAIKLYIAQTAASFRMPKMEFNNVARHFQTWYVVRP